MNDTVESISEQVQNLRASNEQITRLAIKGMCLQAREMYPDARYVVLVDSDQGPYAIWDRIEDVDGNTIAQQGIWEECDFEDEHSFGGNCCDDARFAVQDLVETRFDSRNPWEGVVIDIRKVLNTD